MEELSHNLMAFRSTLDVLYSKFAKENLLPTCTEIEKNMTQRFATLRRAKEFSESYEDLHYRVILSMEVLMQAYVGNVKVIQDGYDRLLKISHKIDTQEISKKNVKRIFSKELEQSQEGVLLALECGFKDSLLLRYKRVLDDKLRFLRKWQYYSNDFSCYKEVNE
uniref:Uncharacterized protein n=1 Tax=Euplotes harpa TaxID=151035 RepID=A0A7S3JEB1_9SPIT|mmetsp:Transcript_34952/g.40406  ORF Transcript_34952/g.40406 Transcript_34952/m.40406 type:complete len:165 (+) Transcript_34952:12-506(+)|eukprot:CAMPEP_0168333554 /NCGR_PEP_ID=MMETSP0213-20121227/9679_1 /TAXON_ID=151035 /ORGANISM="Euplotes harpa, Strain FSP1.4" /LENGTH=164 /DNA_ID=CAMNT_0008337905 /DNA_START=12 /DNA_END=506 /DNA_ORIENTATION=+